MRNTQRMVWLAVVSVCLSVSLSAQETTAVKSVAQLNVGPTRIEMLPLNEYERLVLTVAGPQGFFSRQELGAGQRPSLGIFDASGHPLLDGTYTYELRVVPRVDKEVRDKLIEAREAGNDSLIGQLRKEGKLPAGPFVQSGSFSIQDGSFVATPKAASTDAPQPPLRKITGELIDDALIVQGNACIGAPCGNTDNDFSLLKLKGAQPDILFDDVPDNDWSLSINPSGAAQFSIRDVGGLLTPFSIMGGAPDNSLVLASNGNLGLGTSTPAQDVHVVSGNTPSLRLEQDGSGALTPRTWDVGANDANFFVRDVTNGGAQPLRVQAGAPTSSLVIDSIGNIGLGTAAPGRKLHIIGDGTAVTGALVENTTGPNQPRLMMQFKNNGSIQVGYMDTSLGANWGINLIAGNFKIQKTGSTSNPTFLLDGIGNLLLGGVLTQNSDRDTKTDVVPVQPEDVLARLVSLPLSTWSRKDDQPMARHLGPMAQDFAAAFGLGADDRHIAPLDMAGVSMASIQALHGMVASITKTISEKDTEIAELRRENAALADRLASLEKLVAALVDQAK